MSKIDYLKKARTFLRKVLKQRSWLTSHDKSYIDSKFVQTEMNNIEYALPKLISSSTMQQYLVRKEAEIRYLIPARYKKWHDEFRELLCPRFN